MMFKCTFTRVALALVSMLSLAGCFAPDAPPSTEFEALATSDPKACPDLSGSYRLQAETEEYRFFSPYLLPPHRMDMVQLTPTSERWFLYTVKMEERAFQDAVKSLRASDSTRLAAWQEQLQRWQKVVADKGERSVIEGELLKHGPLPERRGLITPRRCEDGWAMVDYGSRTGARNADGEAQVWDTEVWLAKSAAGALLFRYDEFTTAATIFNSSMRTGLANSRYAKLDAVPAAAFNWSVEPGLARQPSVAALRRTELPGMLVDIQQHLSFHLPIGAELTYFAPAQITQAALDGGDEALARTPFWLDVRGTLRSNGEVHSLMRALQENSHIAEVQLASVRHLESAKIEFGFRLSLNAEAK
ncbi:MAG: hypothetical protein ACT4NL_11555 [Pseudomarimonas sp.]